MNASSKFMSCLAKGLHLIGVRRERRAHRFLPIKPSTRREVGASRTIHDLSTNLVLGHVKGVLGGCGSRFDTEDAVPVVTRKYLVLETLHRQQVGTDLAIWA